MGRQVIKQPDGRLAIWSSNSDTWVVVDAEPEEVVDYFVQHAARDARRSAEATVAAVVEDRPRDVYYQFAMSFEEAEALRRGLDE